MLSKWIFVCLLVLGVQNISAGILDKLKNPLDTLNDARNKLIEKIPNPLDGIKIPNPFDGIKIPEISFPKFLEHECKDQSCETCFNLNIMDKINQRMCAKMAYNTINMSVELTILLNGKELITRVISGQDPKPFCCPIPNAPVLQVCVDFYGISMSDKNVQACLKLTMKAKIPFLSPEKQLWERDLSCMKIGKDGVSLPKPGDDSNVPQPEEPKEKVPVPESPESPPIEPASE